MPQRPTKLRRVASVATEHSGKAAFGYSMLAAVSKLESWEDVAKAIKERYEELTGIVVMIGDIVATITLPIDVFAVILLSPLPFSIPTEMRVPILVGALAASVLLAAAFRGMARPVGAMKNKVFDALREALIYPLRPEFRTEVASHVRDRVSKNPLFNLIGLPIADYYRGLKSGLPHEVLLLRYNRAAADMEAIINRKGLGPSSDDPDGRRARRRGKNRLLMAGAVFVVVLVDLVWHHSLSSGLALLSYTATATIVVILLLIAAVVVMLLLTLRRIKSNSSKGVEKESQQSEPGRLAGFFSRMAFRFVEKARDQSWFEPGEVDLVVLPRHHELAEGCPTPILTHRNDLSYASLTGVELGSWSRRPKLVTRGGRKLPLGVRLDRETCRESRKVCLRYCPAESILETVLLPILGRQGRTTLG